MKPLTDEEKMLISDDNLANYYSKVYFSNDHVADALQMEAATNAAKHMRDAILGNDLSTFSTK